MKSRCWKVEAVNVNYVKCDGVTDIAKTVMAQCYKGFGTSYMTQNGALVKLEKKDIKRSDNIWESFSDDI